MVRKLNSDQLGKKGEARFQEQTTDAKLIGNPSSWDRKGWDFIVDWPMDTDVPLDSRPTPRSCLVQVKSVWAGAKSVRLTLSAIEHLAKDIKPAFLHLYEVNDDLEFVRSRTAHIEGDLLAVVLKALRKATADEIEPNKVPITLSLERWFRTIESTPDALRQAFEGEIGSSMPAYAQRKQFQLSELGFGPDRHIAKTTFQVDHEDHAMEAFLGLRKVTVSSFDLLEKRFGILFPLKGIDSLGGGELEFIPSAHDKCLITVSDPVADNQFSFRGKMIGLPAALHNGRRFMSRIQATLFDLILDVRIDEDRTQNAGITFTMGSPRTAVPASAAEWREMYGMLWAMTRNEVRISIKPSKIERAFEGMISATAEAEQARRWQTGFRVADLAANVMNHVGSPGYELSLGDLERAAGALDLLHTLIHEPNLLDPLHLSTELPMDKTIPSEPVEALYFGVVDLGRHWIAYAASITIEFAVTDTELRWTASNYLYRDAQRIAPKISSFEKFVEDSRRRTSISNFISAQIGQQTDPRPTARLN